MLLSLFAWAVMFTWIYLFSHQDRVFDTNAHPGLALLGILFCFILSVVLWSLIACLVGGLFWVIGRLLRLPGYIRLRHRRFWQKWTLPSRRFGWTSLRGFQSSRTPLLSEAECSHDCHSTSKLCQECYHIVKRSCLISGSVSLFTRRVEWHKWAIPVLGSSFRVSRNSCQLCHVLWNSLDERTRLRLAGPYTPRQALDTVPWLWLQIWEDENGGWVKAGHHYNLSLFDDHGSRPENRHNLSGAIEIKEGFSSSADSRFLKC